MRLGGVVVEIRSPVVARRHANLVKVAGHAIVPIGEMDWWNYGRCLDCHQQILGSGGARGPDAAEATWAGHPCRPRTLLRRLIARVA